MSDLGWRNDYPGAAAEARRKEAVRKAQEEAQRKEAAKNGTASPITTGQKGPETGASKPANPSTPSDSKQPVTDAAKTATPATTPKPVIPSNDAVKSYLTTFVKPKSPPPVTGKALAAPAKAKAADEKNADAPTEGGTQDAAVATDERVNAGSGNQDQSGTGDNAPSDQQPSGQDLPHQAASETRPANNTTSPQKTDAPQTTTPDPENAAEKQAPVAVNKAVPQEDPRSEKLPEGADPKEHVSKKILPYLQDKIDALKGGRENNTPPAEEKTRHELNKLYQEYYSYQGFTRDPKLQQRHKNDLASLRGDIDYRNKTMDDQFAAAQKANQSPEEKAKTTKAYDNFQQAVINSLSAHNGQNLTNPQTGGFSDATQSEDPSKLKHDHIEQLKRKPVDQMSYNELESGLNVIDDLKKTDYAGFGPNGSGKGADKIFVNPGSLYDGSAPYKPGSQGSNGTANNTPTQDTNYEDLQRFLQGDKKADPLSRGSERKPASKPASPGVSDYKFEPGRPRPPIPPRCTAGNMEYERYTEAMKRYEAQTRNYNVQNAPEDKQRDNAQLRSIQAKPEDLDRRLKKPESEMSPAERDLLHQHRDFQETSRLQKQMTRQLEAKKREYQQNGWDKDSQMFGISREAFLQDVNNKDINKVSVYDANRALWEIDAAKKESPTAFNENRDGLTKQLKGVDQEKIRRTHSATPTGKPERDALLRYLSQGKPEAPTSKSTPAAQGEGNDQAIGPYKSANEYYTDKCRSYEEAYRKDFASLYRSLSRKDMPETARLAFGEERPLNFDDKACMRHHAPQKDDFKLNLRGFGDGSPADMFGKNEKKADGSHLSQAEKERIIQTAAEENAKKDLRKAVAAPKPEDWLKKPTEALDQKEMQTFLQDNLQTSVDQMQDKMRTKVLDHVAKDFDHMEKDFQKILENQGVIGNSADYLKNNVGTNGGWIIDSSRGSDAVRDTVRETYRAQQELLKLRDFKGNMEDFGKEFTEKRNALVKQYEKLDKHMGQFKESQANWVDGVADFGSIAAATAAVGLAPVTGGGSLALGALVAGGTKIGIKALEKGTGEGLQNYTGGEIAMDGLTGSVNGLFAAGGSMLTKGLTKQMLTKAGYKMAEKGGITLAQKAGSHALGSMAGGALDGGGSQFTNSLLKGEDMETAMGNGGKGALLGMVLNPLSEVAVYGLGKAWGKVRGKAPEAGSGHAASAEAGVPGERAAGHAGNTPESPTAKPSEIKPGAPEADPAIAGRIDPAKRPGKAAPTETGSGSGLRAARIAGDLDPKISMPKQQMKDSIHQHMVDNGIDPSTVKINELATGETPYTRLTPDGKGVEMGLPVDAHGKIKAADGFHETGHLKQYADAAAGDPTAIAKVNEASRAAKDLEAVKAKAAAEQKQHGKVSEDTARLQKEAEIRYQNAPAEIEARAREHEATAKYMKEMREKAGSGGKTDTLDAKRRQQEARAATEADAARKAKPDEAAGGKLDKDAKVHRNSLVDDNTLEDGTHELNDSLINHMRMHQLEEELPFNLGELNLKGNGHNHASPTPANTGGNGHTRPKSSTPAKHGQSANGNGNGKTNGTGNGKANGSGSPAPIEEAAIKPARLSDEELGQVKSKLEDYRHKTFKGMSEAEKQDCKALYNKLRAHNAADTTTIDQIKILRDKAESFMVGEHVKLEPHEADLLKQHSGPKGSAQEKVTHGMLAEHYLDNLANGGKISDHIDDLMKLNPAHLDGAQKATLAKHIREEAYQMGAKANTDVLCNGAQPGHAVSSFEKEIQDIDRVANHLGVEGNSTTPIKNRVNKTMADIAQLDKPQTLHNHHTGTDDIEGHIKIDHTAPACPLDVNPTTGQPNLKVMTWNVQDLSPSSQGNKWATKIKDLGDEIKKAKPDVLALQEAGASPRDVYRFLKETGLDSEYKNIVFLPAKNGEKHGVAVLTRDTVGVKSVSGLDLGPKSPRAAAHVVLDVGNGQEVHLVNSHGKSNGTKLDDPAANQRLLAENKQIRDEELGMQSDLATSLHKKDPNTRMIMVGDMNQSAPFITKTASGLGMQRDIIGPTHLGQDNLPTRQLDHVLSSGMGRPTHREIRPGILNSGASNYASDHLPVVVEYDIR